MRKVSRGTTAAACLGTFPCSLIITLLLGILLPLPEKERVIGSGLLFPLIWVAMIVWVFATPRVRRASAVLATITLTGAGIVAVVAFGVGR